MAGVEVLAGLGFLATGVFRYNRENYEFDQEQRFEREELRLKMQVERFSLFRDDVRDLVELTVSKMDLYHMVGALFLKACIVYYCEGFWVEAPPVYLLSLYYLSNACSVVYLLLGVWLAMHASISSHSYGTKLLTRFIRLPIPGSDEMNTMNARFADFERQGVKQMMRLPFANRREGKAKANEWQQRAELDAPNSPSKRERENYLKEEVKADLKALPDDDDEILEAVEMRTQRHVNLFRKLQARWQCYDAYARVCMSLGARQLVQTITYFLIGITTVENRNFATVFALVVVLQAVGAAISVLDISQWPCWKSLDLTLLGCGPGLCAATAWVLTMAGHHRYQRVSAALALVAFPLEILWFELLLRAATPTDDMAALPRHFRSVMFMDVFAEVDDPEDLDVKTGRRQLKPEERDAAERALSEAVGALHMAQAAIRRWQALPGAVLSEQQSNQRTIARRRLKQNIKELQHDLLRWSLTPLAPEDVHLRAWEDVSVMEREEDPLANAVLGPLLHHDDNGVQYYLDLERGEYVSNISRRRVFTLVDLLEKVKDFEHEVTLLREAAGDSRSAGRHEVGADSTEEEEEEATPLTRRPYSRRGSSGSVALQSDPKKYKDGSTRVQAEPVRLPWKLVHALTRCLELAWLACFIMALLRDYAGLKIDTMEVHIEEDRRRLAASPFAAGAPPAGLLPWSFEPVEVSWPMGAFFRPEALACLPASGTEAAGAGRFLVRSPFALYQGTLGLGPAALEEVPGSGFAPGTTAVCGPSLQKGTAGVSNFTGSPFSDCLLAAPSQGGIQLWPWGGSPEGKGSSVLELDGAPWRVLAGATVPCEDVGLTPAAGSSWCMLLAGWTGGEALSVAAVPSLGGPGSPPQRPPHGAWRPHYELSLAAQAVDSAEAPSAVAPAARGVAALHLEPGSGRLWALLEGGELLAWALLPGTPRLLGRWPAPSSASGLGFQAAAVCEAPGGRGVFLAGRTASGPGTVGGPAMLRAVMPPAGL